MGGLTVEEQLKKEIAAVAETLKDCERQVKEGSINDNDHVEFIYLEEAIRLKDDTIKKLGLEI